jgi:predicted ester cyclase
MPLFWHSLANIEREYPMSTEEDKSLIRSYVEEVLNGGKFEVLDDLLSPNYKRYLSPTTAPLPPEAQKQRLAGLRAAFPDIHLTIEDLVVEDDRVAFRMTLRGTHQGPFQGITPTGRQVTVSAIDVVHIENGRFSEHWGGPDMLALLQQVGAVVSAGPEKK